MKVPFVDLGRIHRSLADGFAVDLRELLANNEFILGNAVDRFEAAFAAYCGASHAVGLSNGTDALHFAVRALGLGPGDEVLIPALTFVSTAFGVTYAGATPVFCDVDPVTYHLDLESADKLVTPRTKAVIPVHLYGLPVDMTALQSWAKRRHLKIIEDACQAHGASWNGQNTGSFGDAAAFSFYPAKNLGALGDGGAVTTNDAEIARTIQKLRNVGQAVKNHHEMIGYNGRLDTLHAAFLQRKLAHLNEWNDQRRAVAAAYNEAFRSLSSVVCPQEPDGARHVYHLYVLQVSDRDRFRKALADRGVDSGVHYPNAVPLVPAYASLGYKPSDVPVAARLADRIVSLPIFAGMTKAEVDWVIDAVRQAVS